MFGKLFKKKDIIVGDSNADAIEKILKIKRGINLCKKKLADPKIRLSEKKKLEEDLELFWKAFENAQDALIHPERGLYIGLGYDLKNQDINTGAKPEPLYINWKAVHGHLGIQGSTRVGKTVLLEMLMKQLIRKGENLVVVDPKGGFGQEVVATMLEELKVTDQINDFIYISPAFVELSDRLNVIYGLSNEEIASMVAKLTETPGGERFFSDVVYKVVLAVTTAFEALELKDDPLGESTKAYTMHEIMRWNELVKNKGLVRTVVDDERQIYSPDLIDVSQSDMPEYKSTEPTKGDIEFSRKLMTFKELAKYSTFDNLSSLKDALFSMDYDAPAMQGYDKDIIEKIDIKRQEAILLLEDVLQQDKAFFTKISVSLSTILTQLSAGNMGKVFCDIRINPLYLSLHDKNKKTFAIIQPFPLKFKNVASMSVKIFMSMLESIMGSVGSSGRALNHRVNFVIDEASTVVFNGIETLFNQSGGLGVSLYVATQSFSDWELKLGRENARVVMDNINNIIRMRMNDNASCKLVTEEFGIKKKMTSSVMYHEGESRYMHDVKDEWIVPPEMVSRLPVARAFVKTEQNIYIADLPYFSGPKGFLEMPEVEIETVTKELVAMESQMKSMEIKMVKSLEDKTDKQYESFNTDDMRAIADTNEAEGE